MMPRGDLLVIVPSRGRPQSVQAMVDAWLDTDAVSGDAELLFAVDDDDPLLLDYCEAVNRVWEASPPFKVHLRHGPRRRMIGTLNEVAVEFADQFSMLSFMGDDHRPRGRFVEEMRTALGFGGDGPWIAYGNDGLQGERMATAVFMTSDIVKTLGYFTLPTLTHMNADLLWVKWGTAIERLVYLKDTEIEHLHPYAGKAEWDEGYASVNHDEMYSADDEAYYAYLESGFEADVEKLRALL